MFSLLEQVNLGRRRQWRPLLAFLVFLLSFTRHSEGPRRKVCAPPKFMCRDLIPQGMVFGRIWAFCKVIKVIRAKPSWMGLVSLIEDPRGLPLPREVISKRWHLWTGIGFPGGASGKEPACQRGRHKRRGQEDPLEGGMATHSSILAWRSPWIEDPGALPWGRKETLGTRLKRHIAHVNQEVGRQQTHNLLTPRAGTSSLQSYEK